MQTLAQIRNDVLKKLNKKKKLGFSSLGSPDSSQVNQKDKKLKAGSNKEKFNKKDQHKGFSIDFQKQNHKRFQGDQSICSSSKRKKVNEDSGTVSLKRRRKQKKKRKKDVVPDETAQLQRRVKYLLVRMKLEQNLIDAYLGEGWKGQSREKIKPEKELQRAKNQILKCKLGIRDTVHQLDSLSSVGQIDHTLIDPDGSVHHEHITCKKCKTQEVSEDNDIILCDGTCNCAFHQKCIDPPLATKDIPPEDEGWLCKYCDCKMEILEAMNAHLGTQFSAFSNWQDIFKEEARLSNGRTSVFNPEEEWPDDESDDNDYDPDGDENDINNRCSMEGSDSDEETSTGSSCCSLESELLSESGFSGGRHKISSNGFLLDQNCVPEYNENEITGGPRKRCAVDYKKLYDEMFGKDTTTGDVFSEDEDWDPSKRKQREKESDVANTLITLCESEVKHSDPQTLGVGNNNLLHRNAGKPLLRIPLDVVQKLRLAFSETELPSRDAKRKISEEVGLEYKKVNKWFKNARYMALKNKQRERAACSPEKSNSIIDKADEVTVPKCSPIPIYTHKNKQLKKVSWKANLATLISPSKKLKLKKTSLGKAEGNMELGDDISLKKHLIYLKTRSKISKKVQRNSEQLQRLNAEKQMEHLCYIQAKLWKLKRILSTIEKAISNKADGLSSTKEVVYVPFAELKEKE